MKTFWVSIMLGSILLCCRTDLFAQDESNAALKLDSILWTCYWADSAEFKGLEKWKFYYDGNKDAAGAYYYIYNSIFDNYRPEYKAIYSYNNNNHSPINGVFYQGYTDWVKWVQFQYTYDSKGILIQKKLNSWQEELEFWYDNMKLNYEYDSSAKLILITSYFCTEMVNGKATKWKTYAKNSFSYDSTGRIVQNDIYCRWGDDTLKPWLLEDRKEYLYNTDGYSILYTDYIYNLDSPAGETKYELDYFYNSTGDISLILTYQWDQSSNAWKYMTRKKFTYDIEIGAGQLIIPINDVLNENTIINDFTFDYFTHKVTEMTYDRYSYGQWIPDYKGVFYYSDFSQSNAESVETTGFEIYPNPAKEHIHFKWNSEISSLQVIIYDISGRAILSCEAENGSGINLEQLSEGVYIFKFVKGVQIVFSKKVFVL